MTAGVREAGGKPHAEVTSDSVGFFASSRPTDLATFLSSDSVQLILWTDPDAPSLTPGEYLADLSAGPLSIDLVVVTVARADEDGGIVEGTFEYDTYFSPPTAAPPLNGSFRVNRRDPVGLLAGLEETPTYSLSGTLGGATDAAVSISVQGGWAARTTRTDATGNYVFYGLPAGTYVITPDPTMTFDRPSRTVTVTGTNVSGVNFTLDLSGSLILFPSARHDGNLGGRAGADTICATARAALSNLSCRTVHAVLSADATDDVARMPTRFGLPTGVPVRRPNGVLIDTSWPDMFDGIRNPIAPELTTGHWTGGGDEKGNFNGFTCRGWTSAAESDLGLFGGGDDVTMYWLYVGGGYSCDGAHPLICACW